MVVTPSPLLILYLMTKVILYKYDGHPSTVNKVLGDGREFTGHLKEEFEVTRPYLNLRSGSLPEYNYCYIDTLGRYYFIQTVTYLGNQTYELSLRVDVLKTYESEILAATGVVTETDTPDPYISNRETVYKRQPNFEKVGFANTGLLNETGSIIMVTLKGNDNDAE